jgi:two-component system, OmpR family, phosphate regulon response regulator PhoB
VRSVLYRFPDLGEVERLVSGAGESELDLGMPAGEAAEDGEWVLAVFELGPACRAMSAAARTVVGPEGARLLFEPRDWKLLADFSRMETNRQAAPGSRGGPAPASASPSDAPRPPSSGARTRTGTRARASGTGARILIVDDDVDIREVVSAMLEAVGLVVVSAPSAEEALVRVRQEPFDLLVFDWNLPKMTGIELCRLIRKEPGLELLPVLFLTANASSQDMVDAFACGADDYVVKPFRAPELGARIFSLLRRSRVTS